MELHPDVNPDPLTQERFKEVTYSYEILSDPAKRAEYDLSFLSDPAKRAEYDLSFSYAQRDSGRNGGQGFSDFDFSDIFGDAFRGTRTGTSGSSQSTRTQTPSGGTYRVASGIYNRSVSYDGDIVIMSGAIINGSVKSSKGDITLESGAVVNGSVKASSGAVHNNGTVHGSISDSQGSRSTSAGRSSGSSFSADGVHFNGATFGVHMGDFVGGATFSGRGTQAQQFSTDGSINITNSGVAVFDASYVRIGKNEQVFEATSLRGGQSMVMQRGFIYDGSVKVNGIEVGRDTGQGFDLRSDPRTREFAY